MTEFETVTYEVADGIATITINRPERLNTLCLALKRDFDVLFTRHMVEDRSIRCVILTGTGEKAFCAGADMKEYTSKRLHPSEYFARQKFTHRVFSAIEQFEQPVIAAINGVAMGGGLEIALAADLRIAADHARLGLTEARLGAMPAAGGTQRLPRLVGRSRAKWMMFTGQVISAEDALKIGLVDEVIPGSELAGRALHMAQEIAAMPPLSVKFIKHAVNAGIDVDLDTGMEIERYAAGMVMESNDRHEGMNAFLAKREPDFNGR